MASLESHFQFRLWPNRSYPILATQLHALPQSGHRPTDMSASCQSGLMHCNKRSVGPLDLLSLGRVGDITELATTGLQVRRSSPGSMLSAAQLRNRRLQQDEISARLARVECDDRATLCGERETFRLAIQIAEPPRIKERSGAATRRETIEPRNREGLITEQIEATIRTYFEVTEVGAGFGQCLVGKPDCESNEPVVSFFNRPPLAVRQCTAVD